MADLLGALSDAVAELASRSPVLALSDAFEGQAADGDGMDIDDMLPVSKRSTATEMNVVAILPSHAECRGVLGLLGHQLRRIRQLLRCNDRKLEARRKGVQMVQGNCRASFMH